MMRNLAIVLFSRGISGAAIRFGRFFSHLQSSGLAEKKQIYLYINSMLVDELNRKKIYIDIKSKNVVLIDDKKYKGLANNLFYIVNILYFIKIANLYRSVHFVCGGVFFVLPIKIAKIMRFVKSIIYITFPSTNLKFAVNGSRKWMLITYFAIKAADKIDCLNPSNSLSKYVSDSDKISITPCSFSDVTSYYYDDLFATKENNVLFMGLFSKDKQPLLFLKSIPLIDNKVKNVNYFLIGDGPQKKEIYDELSKMPKDLSSRVFVGRNDDPVFLLKKSKVFCSLQRIENYPSQSLIEAMLAKNYVIATDVGDTRRLVKKDFAALVPNDAPEEIAKEVIYFLGLPGELQDQITTRSRDFVFNNCSISRFSEYFFEIHNI